MMYSVRIMVYFNLLSVRTVMKKTVTFIILCLLLICQPAIAIDLQTAKAQGLVGETSSGYLAPVKATDKAKKLVSDINKKRKEHYRKIAKNNNTPLNAVEQLAGKKAIAKTPAGQFIFVNNSWQKK